MKISPVISFSILLGLLAFVFSISGIYFLDNSLLYVSQTYLVLGLISISIFISTLFLFSQYIKRKFKNIYRSIGLAYDKAQENFGEGAEEKIEHWLSKKTSEIQELKSHEAYRREFFGNLAHELKTPVFSVEGYILTLLEGGLEDEKNNRKFLGKAAKGIDRITKIIQDMDTITKIESGNLKLDLKKIALFDLIKNVTYELEDIALKKNITVLFEKPAVIELFVSGDKLKLEQVFTNLIANSIHYGNKNGTTKVTIKEFNNKVEVSVSDDGIGISEKHIPRLFERFYRVEKSRDRNQGGSGIGLAIVKHIIEAHKQTIKVKSKLDEGTSFTFTLSKHN